MRAHVEDLVVGKELVAASSVIRTSKAQLRSPTALSVFRSLSELANIYVILSMIKIYMYARLHARGYLWGRCGARDV